MKSYFSPSVIDCAGRPLDLSKPQVMGILNVTPDSFSDGGKHYRLDAALRHAQRMIEEGASLIDVGGESTRPGAASVGLDQELARVAPVVEALVREFDVVVSLDTSAAGVISECGRLGAGMINDVRSLSRPGALEAASASAMAVCLMHMNGEPTVMQLAPHYDQPIELEVVDFLRRRVADCVAAGVDAERLLIDPGFGFGKLPEHNLRLMNELVGLVELGLPILVGTSRKSMIGAALADAQGVPRALGEKGEGRLYGGLALTAMAIERGARIIRTHDVAATRDVVEMTWAVLREGKA